MYRFRLTTKHGFVVAAALIALSSVPVPARAWWVGTTPGIIVAGPPIVVRPPPVYVGPPVIYPVPPPVYVSPTRRIWIPGHWNGPYWVPPHWK